MNESTEDKSIDQLRAEAAETRQRVSQDVEALAHKVSPQNLKQEAKQSIKDAGHRVMDDAKDAGHRAMDNVKDTANEAVTVTRGFASDVGRAARENPIPTAMIGVGLGWLAYAAVQRRSSRTQEPYPRNYDSYANGTANVYSRGIAERGRETAERYQSQLTNAAERGREKTSEFARGVSDNAERRARQVANRATNLYEDNPLMVGALTLGAGLAVGAMLPHTSVEDRMVGEYRDKLFDRVKDGAENAVEHGKSALVDAAADAAKQAMSHQQSEGSPDRAGSLSTQQNGI